MKLLDIHGEEFASCNQRRKFLIDKRYIGGGLSDYETAELRHLQQLIRDSVNAVYPTPEVPQVLKDYMDSLKATDKR